MTDQIGEWYRSFRAIIDPWSKLGAKNFPGGTICIGHIPHVAPEAYLHRLLPPLGESDLRLLQDKIGRPLHPSLRVLMLLHNGFDLFNQWIGVDGLRTSYRRRDIDAMMEQPFDMVLANTRERPGNAPNDLIFIGSFGDERDRVAMDAEGCITIWNKRTNIPETSVYRSVFEFVLTEADQISRRFDTLGRRI